MKRLLHPNIRQMASHVCRLLEEKWETSRGRVGISPTPQVPGCVFELVFLGLGSVCWTIRMLGPKADAIARLGTELRRPWLATV